MTYKYKAANYVWEYYVKEGSNIMKVEYLFEIEWCSLANLDYKGFHTEKISVWLPYGTLDANAMIKAISIWKSSHTSTDWLYRITQEY